MHAQLEPDVKESRMKASTERSQPKMRGLLSPIDNQFY